MSVPGDVFIRKIFPLLPLWFFRYHSSTSSPCGFWKVAGEVLPMMFNSTCGFNMAGKSTNLSVAIEEAIASSRSLAKQNLKWKKLASIPNYKLRWTWAVIICWRVFKGWELFKNASNMRGKYANSKHWLFTTLKCFPEIAKKEWLNITTWPVGGILCPTVLGLCFCF